MQEIKISFAPMEGVTTVTFRRIFREFFEGVDRFYTPFLAATQTRHFKNREKKEYLPYDPMLIPQVLTGKADQFLWAARTLADAGYAEVNLNLGCPAATVVTKKKGSGLLADPEALDLFLEEIFREQYGMTIGNYVLLARIGRAKQLLRFSDMTMETISAEIGMHDASYFSRIFRKVEGISPGEYRKMW